MHNQVNSHEISLEKRVDNILIIVGFIFNLKYLIHFINDSLRNKMEENI